MRAVTLLASVAVIAITDVSSLNAQWSGEYRINRRDEGRSLSVSVRGKVWFTDDDRDVARLENRGRLLIEESRDGAPDRILVIAANESGQLQRTYLVDGRAVEYGADAAAWFAGLLPELIRESGVGAEERARRILQRSGAAGLLAEAEQIRSSSTRRRYLTVAFEEGRLTGSDATRAVRAIEPISSSSEKATLLLVAAGRVSLDEPSTRSAYFDGARTISSSSELRRVLIGGLDDRTVAEPVLIDALYTSRRISSSSERGAVLTQIAERHRLTSDALREAFFASANEISSSHTRREVLIALLRAQGDQDAVVRDVVRSARTISSGSEKAAVLMEASSRVPPS
jgi:hypothetical protein